MKNEKSYEPQIFEKEIYKKWEDSKCFHADPKSNKPAFCIIMPPPNVTSVAHVGHGMGHRQTLLNLCTFLLQRLLDFPHF